MTGTTSSTVLMQRVMEQFAEAVNLAPKERMPFVNRLRRDDPDLAAEIDSLLAAYESTGNFLAPLNFDRAAAALGIREDQDKSGTVVGAYRIVRELGRGGMGVVYMAERADGQFDQQVALKLIKRGMDSDEVQRRFLTERQILAQLNHPNIARLLDGGISEDDQPYFAMEYVEGTPLIEYCDARRLTIRERLRLFASVCRAVQHAHVNLIVHRDIKPSNILVTEDGQPKLLDFGIAKLLSPEQRNGLPVTRTALRPMTPEFASPEQIRGEAVTTASDVYQLGVLLYALLAGRPPFRPDSSDMSAVAASICENMPAKPSVTVGSPDKIDDNVMSIQAIALARQTTPPRLARTLKGDLDNMVLMALRKEPQRRYASAEQMHSDVLNYLRYQPMLAHRDTLAYRSSKFLQRHPLGVAATLLATTAFVVMVGFHTLRLQSERDRVQAEATKATRVAEFMTGLFKAANPVRLEKEQLSARELLDRGAQSISTDLTDEPEVQAHLMQVLGEVYEALERRDKAKALLEDALATREKLYGPEHVDVAQSLYALGRTLYFLGDYPAAQPLLERAAAIQEKELGPAHIDLAETLGRLFMLYGRLDDMEQAEAVFERAVAISEQALGVDHPRTAKHLNNFALLIRGADEARARDLFKRVVAIDEKALGPDHPYVAMALFNLASIKRQLGEPDGLEALYQRVETIYIEKIPQTGRLGALYIEWALFHVQMEQFDKASATYEKAIDIYEKSNGGGQPDVAYAYGLFGDLLTTVGDYPRALELHRRALSIREQHLGPEHSLVAYSLELMGRTLIRTDDHAQAEVVIDRALGIFRDTVAPGDGRLAKAWITRGELWSALGRHAEAERAYRSGLAAWSMDRPPEFPGIAHAKGSLAGALHARGNFDEAESLLLSGYEVLKHKTPVDRRIALERLIALYAAWGKPQAAEPYRHALLSLAPTDS